MTRYRADLIPAWGMNSRFLMGERNTLDFAKNKTHKCVWRYPICTPEFDTKTRFPRFLTPRP